MLWSRRAARPVGTGWDVEKLEHLQLSELGVEVEPIEPPVAHAHSDLGLDESLDELARKWQVISAPMR